MTLFPNSATFRASFVPIRKELVVSEISHVVQSNIVTRAFNGRVVVNHRYLSGLSLELRRQRKLAR